MEIRPDTRCGDEMDQPYLWVLMFKQKMDKFDYMIVLYAASHCHGPAFLEASLIQRFGSFLDADSTTSFSVSLKIPVNIWAGVASLFCLKSLGFAEACKAAKILCPVEKD